MRKISVILLSFSFCFIKGQKQDSLTPSKWEVSADGNFYMIPDNFIILPVLPADKGVLHLTARY